MTPTFKALASWTCFARSKPFDSCNACVAMAKKRGYVTGYDPDLGRGYVVLEEDLADDTEQPSPSKRFTYSELELGYDSLSDGRAVEVELDGDRVTSVAPIAEAAGPTARTSHEIAMDNQARMRAHKAAHQQPHYPLRHEVGTDADDGDRLEPPPDRE